MSVYGTKIQDLAKGGSIKLQPLITADDIVQLVEKWQRKLNLYHWRISLSETQPSNKNAAEIVMYELRQEAFLRVDYGKLEQHGVEKLEQVIIHELVHILFNTLTVENKIQIKYGVQKNNKEYIERFRAANEVVVEHMAQVLYCLDSK